MNYVVLGGLMGDEGKGLMTDYFCSKVKNPLVVRFSGGHQCSHTVCLDGVTHTFANFGSGTLRGVPTRWLSSCTFDPVWFCNELDILRSKGVKPKIVIDGMCPVVTPYDIIANRVNEGRSRGSCGAGFGTTIEREENHYSLRFVDILYRPVLDERLRLIREYYKKGYLWAECVDTSRFYEACERLVKSYGGLSNCVNSIETRVNDCIYEGSQGLLLDQNHGFYPHVTRASVGHEAAEDLICGDDITEYVVVTRAYQTRHGNGFMTNSEISCNIKVNPNEPHVSNMYQGEFRRSLLDVSLLRYAMLRDGVLQHKPSLAITCLDHVSNDFRYTCNGSVVVCDGEDDFVSSVAKALGVSKVYVSRSPESKNVEVRDYEAM